MKFSENLENSISNRLLNFSDDTDHHQDQGIFYRFLPFLS